MRNITLSADAELIDAARARAAAERTTLNAQFRLWLASFARRQQQVDDAVHTIRDLQNSLRTHGHRFSREEMNAR